MSKYKIYEEKRPDGGILWFARGEDNIVIDGTFSQRSAEESEEFLRRVLKDTYEKVVKEVEIVL